MPVPPADNEDILATARKRFKLCEDAEEEMRREAVDDIRFCAGEQWDAFDRQSRMVGTPGAGGPGRRPCLTINRLIGPLNQTANEARLNQAGIEVHPVDSMSDPDTAEVIEGMIRHIEYVSKADEVYETALEQSTSGSFGYFEVTTRYCGAQSFDQELRIERIVDPFSVYLDPFAREADKSDMRFAFQVEIIPRDEYKRDYPESDVAEFDFYDGRLNPAADWIRKEGVRIARYWTVELESRTLAMIEWPDGKQTAVFKNEMPERMPAGVKLALDDDGEPIERETEVRRVHCYKINGVEILDEYEWLGQWIPILPVLGKEIIVEGKRQVFSLVRFAKDAQRLYNFYRSSEAETVLCGTKAPWVGVKGSFKDAKWASANVLNYAYLEYEPLDIAGNPAPPPIRNQFEPPIQALSLGAAQASDDIKATTNIYDAALGSQGNETSGVAIRQRQSQSGLSNAHFIDNLNRAIRQCGVILCDLIPKIYDTAREVRILGEDRAQQIVKVNQIFRDWRGQDRCYDLQSGQYDVTITVGPSYTTQRQETWDVMTQLAAAYPQLLQFAGDILFQNADFPGAQDIANRLRKALPPGLADTPNDPKQALQMLAAQNQQAQATIQQLTQALNNANEDIRTRAVQETARLEADRMRAAQNDREAALKARIDLITGILKDAPQATGILLAQLAEANRMINEMSSGTPTSVGATVPGGAAVPVQSIEPPPIAMPPNGMPSVAGP